MAKMKLVKVKGTNASETINGSSLNEAIDGKQGDDHIWGNGGNDSIKGGKGFDTVHFSGAFSDYDIIYTKKGVQITHARGTQADGSDFISLKDVERIQFTDRAIEPTQTAPISVSDTASVNETAVLQGTSVLANDVDFQNDPLTVSAVNGNTASVGTQITLASGALLTVNSNGTYTYNPNGQFASLQTGQTGTDSFQYTVSDGQGGTDTTTVNITINGEGTTPVQTPPVAVDDTGTVGEAGVLSGSNVLGNDTDQQNDTLSVSAVNGNPLNVGTQITLASGALVTVNGNGSYTYDPNGQFDELQDGETATDSFDYTVSDGNGGTDTATVTLTINGDNTAPNPVSAGGTSTLNLLDVLQLGLDPSITISDVDSSTLTGAQVAITDGFSAGDALIFDPQFGINGSFDSNTGVLTLTGSASTADYESALESIEFRPGLALLDILQVTLGEREFTYTVTDGELTSSGGTTSTALINVTLDLL